MVLGLGPLHPMYNPTLALERTSEKKIQNRICRLIQDRAFQVDYVQSTMLSLGDAPDRLYSVQS